MYEEWLFYHFSYGTVYEKCQIIQSSSKLDFIFILSECNFPSVDRPFSLSDAHHQTCRYLLCRPGLLWRLQVCVGQQSHSLKLMATFLSLSHLIALLPLPLPCLFLTNTLLQIM